MAKIRRLASLPIWGALGPYIFAGLVLAIWELATRAFSISEFALPKPSAIFTVLIQRFDVVLPHALQTTATTLAGFAIGVAIGFALGVLIGASRTVQTTVYPSLIGFNAVPKVAFIPVIVIWFGIGTIPAIITAALICVFPIVVVVSTSIATVEPELNDVLRALGASRFEMLTKVGIPRSLPYFFGSLKIAITLAFVGAVTAETVAANRGLGFMMIRAAVDFDVVLLFAGLVTVSLLGIISYGIASLVEKRIAGWAFRTETGQIATSG